MGELLGIGTRPTSLPKEPGKASTCSSIRCATRASVVLSPRFRWMTLSTHSSRASATDSRTKRSRPRRRASQAWCSVPLLTLASTITVASERSAMVRLRAGKLPRCTLDGRLVCSRVDAEREPAHDAHAVLDEGHGEPPRPGEPLGGRSARSDDGDSGSVPEQLDVARQPEGVGRILLLDLGQWLEELPGRVPIEPHDACLACPTFSGTPGESRDPAEVRRVGRRRGGGRVDATWSLREPRCEDERSLAC